MWNMNSNSPSWLSDENLVVLQSIGRWPVTQTKSERIQAELSLCLSQNPEDVDVDATIMISKTNKRCCFCRCLLQQQQAANNLEYLSGHASARQTFQPDRDFSGWQFLSLLSLSFLSRLAFVSGPFDDHPGWLSVLCLFLISLPLLSTLSVSLGCLTPSDCGTIGMSRTRNYCSMMTLIFVVIFSGRDCFDDLTSTWSSLIEMLTWLRWSLKFVCAIFSHDQFETQALRSLILWSLAVFFRKAW